MAEVLFFLAGIGAIVGAIGVVAVRNPFYSVLALVTHLLSLAALFLLLRAELSRRPKSSSTRAVMVPTSSSSRTSAGRTSRSARAPAGGCG